VAIFGILQGFQLSVNYHAKLDVGRDGRLARLPHS